MCLKSYFKNYFYDLMFHQNNPISTQWGYYEILKQLPDNISILDIGVGEGIYFTNPLVVNLIKEKNIKIHGIDIDAMSIIICNQRVIKNNLQSHVKVELKDLFHIHTKYDYVLFMESFPVIPNHLFTKFISHSKKICNNDILLYHNLINNDEYTELFAFFKSTILYYITLNDFGKLTTVNMMNDILTKKCDIFSDKISMNVLLKCKYKDMFSLFNLIPYFRDCEIKQYIITISK